MDDSIVVIEYDSFLMFKSHSFKFEVKVYASIDIMNVKDRYAKVMLQTSWKHVCITIKSKGFLIIIQCLE